MSEHQVLVAIVGGEVMAASVIDGRHDLDGFLDDAMIHPDFQAIIRLPLGHARSKFYEPWPEIVSALSAAIAATPSLPQQESGE